MHRYLRVIAAFAVAAICLSAVVPLVCAHECALHGTAPLEDTAEHCHDPAASETATVGAAVPEGCAPVRVNGIALREPLNEPIRNAPLAAADLPVRDGDLPLPALVAHRTPSRGLRAGLSPGAHLPLRI
jgi:hypothetical protein